MTLSMQWVTAAVGVSGVAPAEKSILLQGLLLRADARPSRGLMIFLRPASIWQLMPIEQTSAASGIDLLCATTRFARNEALATFEEILLDLGAWIRVAKGEWNYRYVVLLGWSGSGTLSAFYQAQAEKPTISALPGGRPLDLTVAGLLPADGLIFQGAHASRARMLTDCIDPSVPDCLGQNRDQRFDIYGSAVPQAPYPADFIRYYRQAQRARMACISEFARAQLAVEDPSVRQRPFVIERTMADPHYLDVSIDTNGRTANRCWLGVPEQVNVSASGIARIATPESWLSQWSAEDSNADAVKLGGAISCPFLAIENGADDAVPPAHLRDTFAAVGASDKTYVCIEGASHSYAGQPALLNEVVTRIHQWAMERNFA